VERLSIGEFSARSRLSPKALRLYQELGLLEPAAVDPDTGYRFYELAQLEQAHLVALLRRIALPLAVIKAILALEPAAAARQIATYWEGVEAKHDARRNLAGYIIDLLSGREHVMYDVATRTVPARSLLCQLRHVADEEETFAFGKEFLTIFKERPQPCFGRPLPHAHLPRRGEPRQRRSRGVLPSRAGRASRGTRGALSRAHPAQ
jgi:DNA-binding transcriptional MerR regulator